MLRLALIFAIVFFMVMQAHADPRWHGHGWGWHRSWQGPVYHGGGEAAVGGFLGSLFGSWLWQRREPDVVVVPAEPVRDVTWCIQRYRSYDPYTRTYLGFDQLRHACP